MKKLLFLSLILASIIPVVCLGMNPVVYNWFQASFVTTGTDYTQLTSCVGAWRMNGTTTETDITANGQTLTVSSGDTIERSTDSSDTGWTGYKRLFTAADVDSLGGADGTAVDLNGANQQITLYARVLFNSCTGSHEDIVLKYNSATSNRQYAFYLSDVCKMRGLISQDGTNYTGCDGSKTWADTFSDGNSHSVFMTYDDQYIRIYVDGVLDTSGTNPIAHTAGIYNGNSPFTLGNGYAGATVPLNGYIIESAVFNAALTDSQIVEIDAYGMEGNLGAND